MKIAFFATIVIMCCFGVGCDPAPEEVRTADELQAEMTEVQAEIEAIIASSAGNSSSDCRTVLMPGSCGPAFVYGVIGIDTAALMRLFREFADLQIAFQSVENRFVCDWIPPSKDSLINGVCVGCYSTLDSFDCR